MVEAIHKLPDMRTFKICKFGNGYFSDFFSFAMSAMLCTCDIFSRIPEFFLR